MGYELDQLMKEYGVSTPGKVAYTGPAAPVVPTEPTQPNKKDYTTTSTGSGSLSSIVGQAITYDEAMQQYKKDKAAYDAYVKDPSAFNDLMRKYSLAQKEYNQYADDYSARIAATPMYGAAQFQTGLQGQPQAVDHGANLQQPTYGDVPASLFSKPGKDIADYYTRMRDVGYTDKDIYDKVVKSGGQYGVYNLGRALGDFNIQTELPKFNWSPTAVNMFGSKPPSPDEVTVIPQGEGYEAYWNQPKFMAAAQPELTGSHGGSVHSLAQKYKMGGEVRKFQFGGNEGEPDDGIGSVIRERSSLMGGTPPKYDIGQDERFTGDRRGRFAATFNEDAPEAQQRISEGAAPVTQSVAAQPLTLPESKSTPVSPAANDLMTMLNRYMGTESEYGPELKAARKRLTAESAAFTDLLQKAMKSEDAKPDKAEMYFRLAAAFGAPTKTGAFSENLGMAGKELAEYAKDVRTAKKADRALQLQLGLEAQKARMQAAREELTSLRSLTAEEMKDKRAIVAEYLKSGRPQSEAGKAAIDAGLKQGTPEFTDFVNKYIDDKIRSGNIFKEAMVAIAGGQLNVAQERAKIAGAAEKRQQENAGKLSPAEVKLKSEAETSLTTIDNALADLNKAFVLNKDSFDSSLKDKATLAILEQTGSKDPKVLNTKELLNLLKSAMISSASQKLTGVLSDSDIKLLQSVAGLDAASREERAAILKNAYRALKAGRAAQQKRLDEITRGLYRETTPAPAGEPE